MEEAARPATAVDLPELVAIAELARAEVSELKGGPQYLAREARAAPDASSLAESLADPSQLVLVGTLDDVIVAMAGGRLERLRTGELIAELTEIYVMPEARGVGLGELMLDVVLDWASGRGCVAIEGSVHPGNRDAKNFFERAGMVTRLLRVSAALDE